MAKKTNTERIAVLERALRRLSRRVKELEDRRTRELDSLIGFDIDFPDPDDFDPDESEYKRGRS